VWTTHKVMSSHTHSTFQKGSGQIVGRVGNDAERTAPGEAVPPLVEVAKTQPVFHLEEVSGTLAGFRFPDFARGANVPRFHVHFKTADREAGGHVLDLVLTRDELAINPSARFHLELPTDPTFLACRPEPPPRRGHGPGRAGKMSRGRRLGW
jgi:alpha-acetolactate decarboxylase